jgi:hypothetical protein
MNHAYHTLAVELAQQRYRLMGAINAKNEAERKYLAQLQTVTELENAIIALGHTVDEAIAYGEGESY